MKPSDTGSYLSRPFIQDRQLPVGLWPIPYPRVSWVLAVMGGIVNTCKHRTKWCPGCLLTVADNEQRGGEKRDYVIIKKNMKNGIKSDKSRKYS